ncbi:MAG: VWA domain-containing protein [Bacillota bacterium]
MGLSFTRPWWLLLLPLAVYFAWLWRGDPWFLGAVRRRLVLAVRLAIFFALVLALAGAQLVYLIGRQAVVFVADRSLSADGCRPQIEQWIAEAMNYAGRDDLAAVVSFGANAMVELPMSRDFQRFAQLQAVVESSHSSPAAGLRLAAAMLPSGYRRRVVVLTDGLENLGDALTQAARLRSQGIRVDVYPIGTERGQDLLVEALTVPPNLREGERFSAVVELVSSYETEALLRLYCDRRLIAQQVVRVSPGHQRLLIPLEAGESGFRTYQVRVTAAADGLTLNNEAWALSQVQGKPSVLIIEGQPGDGTNLARSLSGAGVRWELRPAASFPASLGELQSFGSLVLANVPADALSDTAMEMIEYYVRDLGRGLVMLGGEESFGPGGYFRTPVERALPVWMDLRGKGELPNLGLVLVIDKSGSMGGGSAGLTKMDLAKEAALRATEILGEQDQVGVIAFDSTYRWVVPLQSSDDLVGIQNLIASIRADGGTNIYPGLAAAYQALRTADTKLRHIILLTDGQSATGGDYEELTADMREAGITLSTVAVGQDADTALMSRLAELGEGRYYYTNQLAAIPRIFTKETILANRSYLVNASFVPALAAPSAIIEPLLERGVAPLTGYVATSPKAAATVVLVSHQDEPILATWQYGLGRSVAWTPDASGRWSALWLTGAGYQSFWSNLVAWTLPSVETDGTSVVVTSEAGRGCITLETHHLEEGTGRSMARVIGPDLAVQEVELVASGPGLYRGDFDASAPGAYLLQVVQGDPANPALSRTAGTVVPYSPEYRRSGVDQHYLTQLAVAGGGSVLMSPAESFSDNLPRTSGQLPLARLLLALAAVLWPVDVAVRKLFLAIGDWVTLWTRWRRRSAGSTPGGKATLASTLRQARREQIAESPPLTPTAPAVNEEESTGTTVPPARARGQAAPPSTTSETLAQRMARLKRAKEEAAERWNRER